MKIINAIIENYKAIKRVEIELDVLKKELLPKIAAEKDFKPKEVRWDDAPLIGALDFVD